MIPNGKEMTWNGHHLVFESEPDPCRGCFFSDKDECPYCDDGAWVEADTEVGKWHDGIPTKEGRYLLYCSNGTEDFHYNKLEMKGDKLEWRYNWIGEIIAYMPIGER